MPSPPTESSHALSRQMEPPEAAESPLEPRPWKEPGEPWEPWDAGLLPTESSQFLSRQTEPRDPTDPGVPTADPGEPIEGESTQKDEAVPRVFTIVCGPGLLLLLSLLLLLLLLFVLFVLLKRRKLGFSNCLGEAARTLLEDLPGMGE